MHTTDTGSSNKACLRQRRSDEETRKDTVEGGGGRIDAGERPVIPIWEDNASIIVKSKHSVTKVAANTNSKLGTPLRPKILLWLRQCVRERGLHNTLCRVHVGTDLCADRIGGIGIRLYTTSYPEQRHT